MRNSVSRFALAVALSGLTVLPSVAHADERVLCVLPRIRRAEIARELAIEWAGRGAAIEVVQGAPPDLAAFVENAHAQGASAVLTVRLPDGVLGGIEIRYVTTEDGRERRAILHEAYDAIDARAFAIATRDLVRAEESSESLDVVDSAPPPQAPEPEADCPASADSGPHAFSSFYGIAALSWLPARGVAPFGWGFGIGQSVHWASGHGFRIEVVWAYGQGEGDIVRWTTTPIASVDYSFRIRHEVASWLALAWSAEAGVVAFPLNYAIVSTGMFGYSEGSAGGPGLEVGTEGNVIAGSFTLGLAFRWRTAVATNNGPSGNLFLHQVQLQLHLGFEFTI